MRSADLCYTEANLLDNRHPDVWAHLATLAAHLGRFEEAEQVCGRNDATTGRRCAAACLQAAMVPHTMRWPLCCFCSRVGSVFSVASSTHWAG